jgi:3-oxoacyl-[acyl-carrier-protein] synthase-3
MIHLEMKTAGQYHRGIWLTPEESQVFEQEYVPLLSQTILRAVEKAHLDLCDIKLILPHNVNLISWEKTAKALNFPYSKIYLNNIRKYAHCFGSDILINFVDANESSRLKTGDYYLMVTVGLGATFAAAVFKH